MGVKLTAANLGEREGGKAVLQQIKAQYADLNELVVYKGSGFDGPDFKNWVQNNLGWEVRVVRKISPDGIACCEDPNPTPAQVEAALKRARQPGFVLLPKRWVRTGPEGGPAREAVRPDRCRSDQDVLKLGQDSAALSKTVEWTNAWMAAQRRLRVVYDYVSAHICGWNWLTMLRLLLRRIGKRKMAFQV